MEKQKQAEVLKAVLASIQSGSREHEKQLAAKLADLRKKGCLEELMLFLEEEYGGDHLLYGELLRYLAEASNEKIIVNEYVHWMLFDEIRKEGDLFSALQLKQQYNNISFRLNKRRAIDEEWESNCYLIQEMEKFLGRADEKIPAADRNENYIIIAVTQLLGQDHAPTRLALEICRIIEVCLKKKVLLLNVVLKTDNKFLKERGLREGWFWEYQYVKEAFGNFTYTYKDYVCKGYQVEINKDNRFELQALMDTLKNLKPYFIWNIGGFPVYAGVMKQFTTMIYTGVNQGYPGVPADIVVNYFPRSPVENKDERQFLQEHGVAVKDVEIIFPYERSKGKMKRQDYDIPEEAFCLAVVGNRLSQDCGEPFLRVLKKVLEKERDCCVVFIGEEGEAFKKYAEEQVGFSDRLRFFGFQKELCEAIGMTDLFVNPPRLGGGTGGILALNEGKPVIALSEGDVGSFAGEPFICDSLDGYEELILRYKRDSAFYRRQSKAAEKKAEEIFSTEEHIVETVQSIFELAQHLKKD